jgi:hypothetical protein
VLYHRYHSEKVWWARSGLSIMVYRKKRSEPVVFKELYHNLKMKVYIQSIQRRWPGGESRWGIV